MSHIKGKVKIFTLVTGNTLDYHKTFVARVIAEDWVTEVQKVEACDVVLAFCVNSSRLKTIIDAAQEMIPGKYYVHVDLNKAVYTVQ